jgi:hypothetical protein
MNYLKSIVKTLVEARHLSNHAVLSPHMKRFSPAVSSPRKVDGATSPPSSSILQSFHKTTEVFVATLYQVKNCRVYFSVESFKFLAPSNVCFTHVRPVQNCVIK